MNIFNTLESLNKTIQKLQKAEPKSAKKVLNDVINGAPSTSEEISQAINMPAATQHPLYFQFLLKRQDLTIDHYKALMEKTVGAETRNDLVLNNFFADNPEVTQKNNKEFNNILREDPALLSNFESLHKHFDLLGAVADHSRQYSKKQLQGLLSHRGMTPQLLEEFIKRPDEDVASALFSPEVAYVRPNTMIPSIMNLPENKFRDFLPYIADSLSTKQKAQTLSSFPNLSHLMENSLTKEDLPHMLSVFGNNHNPEVSEILLDKFRHTIGQLQESHVDQLTQLANQTGHSNFAKRALTHFHNSGNFDKKQQLMDSILHPDSKMDLSSFADQFSPSDWDRPNIANRLDVRDILEHAPDHIIEQNKNQIADFFGQNSDLTGLARYPKAPSHLFEDAFNQSDKTNLNINASLASHQNLPESIKHYIAFHENPDVRALAAQFHEKSEEIANLGIKDKKKEVREAWYKHHQLTPEQLNVAIKDRAVSNLDILHHHQDNLSPEHLDQIFKKTNNIDVFKHQNASAEQLRQFYDNSQDQRLGRNRPVLEHKNITTDLLDHILSKDESYIDLDSVEKQSVITPALAKKHVGNRVNFLAYMDHNEAIKHIKDLEQKHSQVTTNDRHNDHPVKKSILSDFFNKSFHKFDDQNWQDLAQTHIAPQIAQQIPDNDHKIAFLHNHLDHFSKNKLSTHLYEPVHLQQVAKDLPHTDESSALAKKVVEVNPSAANNTILNHLNPQHVSELLLNNQHKTGSLVQNLAARPFNNFDQVVEHFKDMGDNFPISYEQHLTDDNLRTIQNHPEISPKVKSNINKSMFRDKFRAIPDDMWQHYRAEKYTDRIDIPHHLSSSNNKFHDLIMAHEDPSHLPKDGELSLHPMTEKLKHLKGLLGGNPVHKSKLDPKLVQSIPGKLFDGQGNISENTIEHFLMADSHAKVHYSLGEEWNGPQRHDDSVTQKVLQINFTKQHMDEIREKGLMPYFKQLHAHSFSSSHPVHPHSMGWVRIDDSHEGHHHYDEIQSDIGTQVNRLIKVPKQKTDESDDDTHEQTADFVRYFNQPPEVVSQKFKEVAKILAHPFKDINSKLHAAAHAYSRSQNVKSTSFDTLEDQADQSNQNTERELPVHMVKTYKEAPAKDGYSIRPKKEVMPNSKMGGMALPANAQIQFRKLVKSLSLLKDPLEVLAKSGDEDSQKLLMQILLKLTELLTQLAPKSVAEPQATDVSAPTNASPADPKPEAPQPVPVLTQGLENLSKITTTRNTNGKKEYLLHHYTEKYFSDSKVSSHKTEKDTEWSPEEGVPMLLQQRAEADLKGARPVVSCWIPESAIKDILDGQDNPDRMTDLSQNSLKNHYRIIVIPGEYECYERQN